MGGTMCSCSEEQKYRFKNFVVSAYPAGQHGTVDEEALVVLNSYVSSNPERIPRVCRKVSKLMAKHLRANKVDRVMVSVKMMCSLIEHADSVEGFVPHSLQIADDLFSSTYDWRYHVGAADILSILCYRLTNDDKYGPSRRLVADAKDRLLVPLNAMCEAKITGAKEDAVSVQLRYAAIVALGHTTRCLHGSMSHSADVIILPILGNLIVLMRQRAQKMMSGDDCVERILSVDGERGFTIPSNSALPADMQEQTLRYAQACSFAIGGSGGCVTTAGVKPLLTKLFAVMNEQEGWTVPFVPPAVFKSLVSAMQERPQALGFMVCQALCRKGATKATADVKMGVMQALQGCLDVLPMTGSRPKLVLDYLREAIATAPTRVNEDGDTQRLDAIVALAASLLRAIYRQRNAPQLQSVVMALLSILEDAEGARRQCFALRCMAVAAPYVRTIPQVDRRNESLQVYEVIAPYLTSTNSTLRRWAVRILRGILAGVPNDGRKADTAADPSPYLSTDEGDIAAAEAWVSAVVRSGASGSTNAQEVSVTPCLIVDIADVLTAIVSAYGVNRIPFLLALVCNLQTRCVPPKGGDGAATATMLSSNSATSPLTRAWLHMAVVSLLSCGLVCSIPKLAEYATDILHRRRTITPPELATCFETGLTLSPRLEDRFTSSGIVAVDNNMMEDPLSAVLDQSPVTKLPSFRYVASIIAEAERSDVAAVFGVPLTELVAEIEHRCFSGANELDVSGDKGACSSSVPPAASHFARQPGEEKFTLAAVGDIARAADVVVTLHDGASSARLLAGTTHLQSQVANAKARIAEVLQRYGVQASTRLLPPDAATAELFILPVEEDAASHFAAAQIVLSETQRSHQCYPDLDNSSATEAELSTGDHEEEGYKLSANRNSGPFYSTKIHQEAPGDLWSAGSAPMYGKNKLPSSAYVDLD